MSIEQEARVKDSVELHDDVQKSLHIAENHCGGFSPKESGRKNAKVVMLSSV